MTVLDFVGIGLLVVLLAGIGQVIRATCQLNKVTGQWNNCVGYLNEAQEIYDEAIEICRKKEQSRLDYGSGEIAYEEHCDQIDQLDERLEELTERMNTAKTIVHYEVLHVNEMIEKASKILSLHG